jgi:hypothetical protein
LSRHTLPAPMGDDPDTGDEPTRPLRTHPHNGVLPADDDTRGNGILPIRKPDPEPDPAPRGHKPPEPDRLLPWLRIVVGVTLCLLVAFDVLIDNFGRMFHDPNFHTDTIMFAGMLALLGAYIGVETVTRRIK